MRAGVPIADGLLDLRGECDENVLGWRGTKEGCEEIHDPRRATDSSDDHGCDDWNADTVSDRLLSY